MNVSYIHVFPRQRQAVVILEFNIPTGNNSQFYRHFWCDIHFMSTPVFLTSFGITKFGDGEICISAVRQR